MVMVLVAMVTVESTLVVVSALSPKWKIVSALGVSVKLCTNDRLEAAGQNDNATEGGE